PDYDANETGQDTYQYITSTMDKGDDFNARFHKRGTGAYAKEASEKLDELGIPGIKYFDSTSRDLGEGTRNFVVFKPEDLKILKRNEEKVN
ncbi:MAG: hypothetical protein DRQ39_09335, partial [Gammaproteobacteria bacterium]